MCSDFYWNAILAFSNTLILHHISSNLAILVIFYDYEILVIFLCLLLICVCLIIDEMKWQRWHWETLKFSTYIFSPVLAFWYANWVIMKHSTEVLILSIFWPNYSLTVLKF